MTSKGQRCRPKLSLETGVKVVATFELIFSSALISFLTLALLDVSFAGKTANSIEYFLGVQRELQFVAWYVCWIAIFIKLTLDAFLYRGAHVKSFETCQLWLIVNGATLFIHYAWTLVAFNMQWPRHHCTYIILINFFLGVVKGIEMFLVYKLFRKIKKGEVKVFAISAASLSITDASGRVVRRPSGYISTHASRMPSTSTITEYLPEDGLTSGEFIHSPYRPI